MHRLTKQRMVTNLNNRNQLPEDKGSISLTFFEGLGILSLITLVGSTVIAWSYSCSEILFCDELFYILIAWWFGALLAFLSLISFLFFVHAGRTKNKHIALFLMVILVPIGSCVINMNQTGY